MAAVFPAAINVIVSNVPGPRAPLVVPGHRLVAIYSVGPVLEGIGLNITAWSYQGELHVGILACRDLIPEPQRIADGLATELRALRARAESEPAIATDPFAPS
jgi:diacylglycerol O-acyltransferase